MNTKIIAFAAYFIATIAALALTQDANQVVQGIALVAAVSNIGLLPVLFWDEFMQADS